MICHENVILQNIGLKKAFFDPIRKSPEERCRGLINLPMSHVGGSTEILCTLIYMGDIAVLLHVYKPDLTMDAIQKYGVTAFGQIPAMFNLEWDLPNYDQYDVSSLRFCVYGGQSVSKEFLMKMSDMCGGNCATGLGLTEIGGFGTYTSVGVSPDEMLQSLGYDSPLCPISIREPMRDDGSAGDEKKPGETGEVCFSGPQIFLGYFHDPEKTRESISTDGILYTGDVGSYDETGLHFASRRKFILKPKGFQVYPGEVEDFIITTFPDVQYCAAVGVEHRVYSQGIVAVVQLRKENKPDAETEEEGEAAALEVEEEPSVTSEMILEACRGMASYKRPALVVFVDEFPLNRVKKTNYLECTQLAETAVEHERENGGWDVRDE